MMKGYKGSPADVEQKRKEFVWIKNHIRDATTPEDERKWRIKMDNWRRANPRYAKAVDAAYDKLLDDKVAKMTLEEKVAFSKKLESELERRDKLMNKGECNE